MFSRDYRPVRATQVTGRRRFAAFIGFILLILILPVSGPAEAALPPVRERTSRTVTADALPTVQINGVVWTQVMIGNIVYAGGDFTAARPSGAAASHAGTSRRNLLAYNITTGALNTRFVPGAFNGAVRTLAISPDKKTLYVGGDFTKVGSAARGHFAALNPSTGALKPPKASFNSSVLALAANSKTVFVGGSFSAVNGKARSRLAAVTASNGKLTSWIAKANSQVHALLLTSGSKLLVAGGMFTKLNSTTASGSGAVSPTNGKTKTWKVNKVVKNGGRASAILALATDGSTVYGAGYSYGTGNFEGVYAASSKDGTLRWLQDCHGDTYSVVPIGDVVYSVGHAHYCSNIGGFPDTQPRTAWYRALAVTKSVSGTVGKNGQTSAKTYTNFEGRPAPALLNWFPNLSAGSYTGMSQGAWSVVGNGTYISIGGEFPRVNGAPQQGLVRMAVPASAPNRVGPSGGSDSLALAAIADRPSGSVTVSWDQLWDRDDLQLTYELRRNGVVIDKRTVSTPFWRRSRTSFVDLGAASGGPSTITYQLKVTDPHGNSVTAELRLATPSVSPSDGGARAVPTTGALKVGPSEGASTDIERNVPSTKVLTSPDPVEPTPKPSTVPHPSQVPAADPSKAPAVSSDPQAGSWSRP